MSALDGYRQYAEACHVMPNTVGKHVTVVVALADAALAELEAELSGTQAALNAITKGNMEACKERNAARAELAALKARRCETCRSQEEGLSYCSTLDVLTTEGFYCADWEARR